MKSEHRHELKTNELGRITSDFRRTSERYVHEHRNTALAVAAVVAVGLVGALFWMNRLGSVEQNGWRDIAAAGKGADFANVADKYSGTPLAAWARLREAEDQ